MRSKTEILLIYFGMVITIYIWENILFGNLTAYFGKKKGSIQLPIIIKKVLFPLFNIEKFTYLNIIYQSFNFCLFLLMLFIGVLIGIFGVNAFIIHLVNIYSNFQKYYWLIGPFLLEISLKFL